jgi:RHH-type proline utilization regulon transcriptional repressor/proline dehydrogenase/delta 1-pyrroline-5-carboxylate dehydrogenase
MDITASTPIISPFAALQAELLPAPNPLRLAVTRAYRRDEQTAVQALLAQADAAALPDATALARELVTNVRAKRTRASGVDALMHEFSLSSDEGVALMCLAEALLRIPDTKTADRLIANQIGKGDWKAHLGESPSLFVNAATWGLLITGKLVDTSSENGLSAALSRLIAKGGEPLIRKGVDLAMRMLGNQFVTGQTIALALKNSTDNEARGYRYSYDMLGEAALTGEDAARYYAAYEAAIHAIGRASNGRGIKDGPGISVKLSALHPRYARAQHERVLGELLPRLQSLVLLAKKYNIGLNIDAEEADRLELSLDLMEALAFDPALAGFDGIGFVVQAYQKRCPFVIDYLIDLARRSGRKFMVRLVKGAYWDAEIKRAQVEGMPGYPVYTRKVYTDVSYLVCAKKLLGAADLLYPQFATHNAHTLATIYTWGRQLGVDNYEFQCLYGMGETLYDQVVGKDKLGKACRIYAPVGSHETLLPYLVRRLLENGANSSFVNQIVDAQVPVERLIADPVAQARELNGVPHARIALPQQLFGAQRRNSMGLDLSDESVLCELAVGLASFNTHPWHARPLIAGAAAGDATPARIVNPADNRDTVGHVSEASVADAQAALAAAAGHAPAWAATSRAERANVLYKAADLLEQHRLELMALAIREAGKSIVNAVAEIREAVVHQPVELPAGDLHRPGRGRARHRQHGAGQAGRADAAIAAEAVALLHAAGVPPTSCNCCPAPARPSAPRWSPRPVSPGVVFTGSTAVARSIAQALAGKDGPIAPLIAETGGINALVVDSTALPEQVADAVVERLPLGRAALLGACGCCACTKRSPTR